MTTVQDPPYDLTALERALSMAKIDLMAQANMTFWSTVVMNLEHKIDPTIPTACTDGRRVLYGAEFFQDLTRGARAGLCLHETGHIVLDHPARLNDKDPKIWNLAGDQVVNTIAKKNGFQLPPNPFWFKEWEDWDTQKTYDHLMQNAQCVPDHVMLDLQSPGSGDGDPENGSSQQEHRDFLDDLLVQATMASRAAGDKPGSIPGEIEEYVEHLLNPTIPWFSILKRFMTRRIRADRCYYKPNRRWFPEWFMPKKESKGCGDVACAMDLSGSVGTHELAHYSARLEELFKQLNPSAVHLIQFDTRITKTDRVTDLKAMQNMRFRGRGGTDVDPVLQWAKQNRPMFQLIFTDGHFRTPTINPRLPVIWLINDNPNFQAPFGKVIHFDTTED